MADDNPSTPEMVERVAEAAYGKFASMAIVPRPEDFPTWRNFPECKAKESWRSIARASITAMREPHG